MRSFSFKGVGMTSDRTRSRLIATLAEQGISDESVLSAMEAIPRHLFVEEPIAHLAYENQALPIGRRQTISQPYIVALMTTAVMEVPNVSKVLEIGTGSGYQAAVLSELVDRVYSVERIQSLSLVARKRMRQLSVVNVRIKFGDGIEGWEDHAPFDAVIVTAAALGVPASLKNQVRDGGRIIIPIGRDDVQQLMCWDRIGDEWQSKVLETVTFVPLLSGITS